MTAIAIGCSHTAGVGVAVDKRYTSVLSRLLSTPIDNFGIPGGNASNNQMSLVQTLKTQRPDFVVAQWPNPLRCAIWNNDKESNENVYNASTAFVQLLKQSVENFYQPWLRTIITCDLLCKQAGVPVVHILLEDLEQKYLNTLDQQQIKLHTDQKIPDATWLFDSAASDKLHHSAVCHAQWADRLVRLLNELTTR